MKKSLQLATSIVLPFFAGAVGSAVTTPAISTWYAALTKPPFNPPNWIFGPVWTTLYVLMGIALYRLWTAKVEQRNMHLQHRTVTLFLLHLVVNASWSAAFFGLKNPLLGLIVILLLLAMILVITKHAWRLDRVSAYLLMPYLAWVSFATVLNFSIWWLY